MNIPPPPVRLPINQIICGECTSVVSTWPNDCIHGIVTDPPYGLGFMGKEWDTFKESGLKNLPRKGVLHSVQYDNAIRTKRKKSWSDSSYAGSYDFSRNAEFQLWFTQWAKEMLRICKPGAFMFCFGGTRTFHRLTCAIEDAGWEIRDCMMWLYSSGFPKGHNYAYKIHTKAESEAKHDLRFVQQTYLSKAVYACKKCGQVLLTCLSEQGASELWKTWAKSKVAGSKQPCVEGWSYFENSKRELQRCSVCTMSHGIFADGSKGRIYNGTPSRNGKAFRQIITTDGGNTSYRPQSQQQSNKEPYAVYLERLAQAYRGHNVALKPAWEPIIVAMKPLDGTFAANAEKHGVAGLNINGGRIPAGIDHIKNATRKGGQRKGFMVSKLNAEAHPQGRWPANLILDEETGKILDEQSEILKGGIAVNKKPTRLYGGNALLTSKTRGLGNRGFGDSGGASRFFKTIKEEKECINVNGVEENLNQQSQIEDFVLNLVVIEGNREDKQLNDILQPFMNEIRTALKENSGKNTKQIKSLGQKCVQELKHISMEKLNENPVNNVETLLLINTMTIIQNLLNIDGFVEVVISSTILHNTVLGEKASRFKYCAKASKRERNMGLDCDPQITDDGRQKKIDNPYLRGKTLRQNNHPTVKPLALMKYLCTLLKMPNSNQIILDPFLGSGTTAIACKELGINYIGIEKEAEYCEIAKKRIAAI